MDVNPAHSGFRDALDLAAIGRRLASRAHALGLAVTRANGSRVPIAIGAVPLVVDDTDIAARAATAARLVRATAKAARWRLAYRRDEVFAALGPAERRLVDATHDRLTRLAVARVDFIGSDPLHALEVNSTIPAMQGYSDIAAAAWLATFAGDDGSLARANGSNSDSLLDALIELHDRERGGSPRSIALLCRRGDAQSTELAWIRDRFAARGFDTSIVHPDMLERDGAWLRVGDERIDLVYRHLFLSRLDENPSPALESALANVDAGTLVLNPPAPHLEMKDTLALLSQSTDDDALADALGLDAGERAAIAAHVPWTRRLSEPAVSIDEVAADPDAFVLKRSWSYGGNEVFVGAARDGAGFRESLARTFPHASTWPALVHAAAADTARGGFVVQRAVPIVRAPQWLCTPDAVRRALVATDYAAYASLGASPAWSGVARAATSEIVNIVRGGAVVPVLRRSVALRVVAGPAAELLRYAVA